MFSNDRKDLRAFYFYAWQKYQKQQPLEPLEQQIVSVIQQHPEYHKLFTSEDKFLDKDYLAEFGETNPFLHMGLHLALHEQLSTDRPTGIRDIYKKTCHKLTNQHDAEHVMMQCLAESLWEAQSQQKMPDEQTYLDKLKDLAE